MIQAETDRRDAYIEIYNEKVAAEGENLLIR